MIDADGVRTAYGARAAEYVNLLGSIESTHEADRETVLSWAADCDGPLLDAGCGPGHWTDLLRRSGHDVVGADMVPEFLASAEHRFPKTVFRTATLTDTGAPSSSLAGILAWYSLIHTPPDGVAQVLAEFARVLRPGGRILVGFFEWPRLEMFPHAVVTAYRWPVKELASRIEAAGFRILDAETRAEPGTRPHASITAERS